MGDSDHEDINNGPYMWPQYINSGFDDVSVISLGSTIEDPEERKRTANLRKEQVKRWKQQNHHERKFGSAESAAHTAVTGPTLSFSSLTSSRVVYDTFEEVLKAVGSFGRYQKCVLLLIQYGSIMWVGNLLMISFGAELRPESWECRNNSNYSANLIESDKDFCQQVQNCLNGSNKLVPVEPFLTSFIGEWQLICDRDWVAYFMVAMVSVGRIFGYLIGGHIGDRYGRQRVLFVSQLAICVMSTMVTASSSWKAATTLLTLTGFLFGIVDVVAMVLAMEIVDSRHRMVANGSFQWGFGYLAVAFIAWICPNWRLYLIAINFSASPLLIGYLLIHESPRWMLQAGKISDAADVLTDMASKRWNRRDLEVTSRQLVDIKTDSQPIFRWSFHLFFTSKEMAIQSALMMFALFTYSCVNNSVVGNLDEVLLNPFLRVAIFGLIRLPIPFVLIGLDWQFHQFGRRALLLGSLGVVALTNLIVVVAIWAYGGVSDFSNAFLIIGSCVNASAVYMGIIQSIVESYPTVIRTVALGTFFVADDLGNIVTFQMLKLQSVWPPLFYLIVEFLLLGLIVAVYFILPESKEKKLQDTFNAPPVRAASFYVL